MSAFLYSCHDYRYILLYISHSCPSLLAALVDAPCDTLPTGANVQGFMLRRFVNVSLNFLNSFWFYKMLAKAVDAFFPAKVANKGKKAE